MTTGILIVSYNRPEYFKKCLDSFSKATYPDGCRMLIIDDHSADPEAIRLYNGFEIPDLPITKIRNSENRKIAANIKAGFGFLFGMGCDVVMNFDSDAIIKPCAIVDLIKLNHLYPDNIGTGFNCTTKNADGSERHKILRNEGMILFKRSVGGLNMVCNESAYNAYIKPALDGSGNWDHKACLNAEADGSAIVCLSPSVVQHIGIVSSMGHSTETPDVADDFNPKIKLPDVTLFGIDSLQYTKLLSADQISQEGIAFGDVILLNKPLIRSKEEYSRFMMKQLAKFIKTKFVLTIQWDGYVINPEAWKDEFMDYDFIGATWGFKDGHNVGNGGFSLRSKKLIDILATDDHIKDCHPEDEMICRKYRLYLEENHGIKFATEEIANRFAIEAYGTHDKKYSGQFGFHGFAVDYTGSGLAHIPVKPFTPKIKVVGNTRFKNFA